MAKHLVLQNQWVNGWEYGIVRAFEDAIARITGAKIINYPERHIHPAVMQRVGQGMNKGKYRKYLPKVAFAPEADVLWVILMGPENYELDLYKGWEKSAAKKIVYLCDTLPFQMETIKRLFSNNNFDLCITAFEEAVPQLEKVTQRKWHGIVQAAPTELFVASPLEERKIHFSAYGRRFPVFHEALIDFCGQNNLYYDYTTHDGRHPTADARELYKQYAWHLSNSVFNVSWPVELTNPQRAGYLRPITPRWFEAGLSNCIIVGKGPDNPKFYDELCTNIVHEVDPFQSKQKIFRRLDVLWQSRKALFDKSSHFRSDNAYRWSWDHRVNTILNLLAKIK